ncbi:MAG TPA: pitrilysin family protein [Burkholderiaceae bacterium]|nr:pitrilysin family protein [Burkholderiaceae bacterium]
MSAPASKKHMAAAAGLAVAIGLLASGAARAEPFPTPPAPAEPRPLSVAPPVEQKLPNGLRVVLAERKGVRLVTAQLLVLSGSEVDPDKLAGLAAMTATLLTKGTQRHDATALANAAEALGASLESGAGWNRSAVSITVAEPLLNPALALVAEAVMQPAFAQAELDRARAQALDELKVAYARPGTVASLTAERLLFGAGAYGHPADGTPASLARVGRNDLLALHRAYYRPDNAVLVLAGDITPSSARRLAAKHFGAWRKPAAPLLAAPTASAPAAPAASASAASAPSSLTARTVVVDMPQSGQAGAVMIMPAPPSRVPLAERAIGQVTNVVLGAGYSSRLNQEIRIKRGLSYGAGSSLDARRQSGALRASVQTKNESAAEVVGLVQTEFDRLISTPVPDDELAARKATVIGAFSRSVETTAGLGGAVAALVVAGVPIDDLGKRIDALAAVNPADVQRYAAAHFGTDGRRVVVAGDAAKFVPALQKMAPNLVTVKQDALDLENPAELSR